MIDWNIPTQLLMAEYVGHTRNGAPAPNLQTPDPEAERSATRWLRTNPLPKGDFWDKRWEEHKRHNPHLTDAQRPPWLKESITPRAHEALQKEQLCKQFCAQFFCL